MPEIHYGFDSPMNPSLSKEYVMLVLAMGEHDPDYVDAYYGPPEWRDEVRRRVPALEEIQQRATGIREEVDREAAGAAVGSPDRHSPRRGPGHGPGSSDTRTRPAGGEAPSGTAQAPDPLHGLRVQYLARQLAALLARIDLLRGRRLRFDEESLALYDAVAPQYTAQEFEPILRHLDRDIPGTGSLPERVEAFRRRLIVPRERLNAVFDAAIGASRSRTIEHVSLPPDERFSVEYVTGKSWSGYNWYQGGYESLIQVNVDLPVFIGRAIDLAAHEGYPGHHVYNVLVEQHLVRQRGWTEFSVYALYSPQSLIAEGTANYGVEIAFPPAERLAFEREVLLPLAGVDPALAEPYARLRQAMDTLSFAGNEAARGYLDGEISAAEAEAWLVRYTLSSPERAKQRVRFFDQYRSYVINYTVGTELVRRHIESQSGTDATTRWREFVALLTSPRLPSTLATSVA